MPDPTSSTVLRSDSDGVRVLTMNRPDKLNALNTELTQTLLDELQQAGADPEVRVIVLTGAGRGFCAGADIGEFKDLTADNPHQIKARGDLTMTLHAAFVRIDTPIICAINGYAMGGGCGLALAGDMAVIAESAKIGYPEVRRGAVPAVVLANLVRQVGPKTAFELVIRGQPLTAAEALEMRLVNRVYPDDSLMDETLALAREIAASSADALTATKRLFHRTAGLPLLSALEVARDANIIMRGYNIRKTV